jgi:neopullulanase
MVFTFSGWSKVQLERVEPMFWWVGMKNPELQLLVYGENISNTTVEINYPGVALKQVIPVENPNYLFIYLNIAPDAKPGTFPIKFLEGKKVTKTYTYELKARNTKPNIHQGFNNSDVVYLLMPDRFANGKPDNDNMPGCPEQCDRKNPNGRHGGDIAGIILNLDYIAKTGFTTIWLNPVLENNQSAFTYHGYAISDFYKVDPRYGTNQDYIDLVDKAHERGLKMIMDMIFNHCGSANWFYKDLPMANWINQHPEFTRSNFRAPIIPSPYTSDYDKNIMLTGWFDTNMPDLNQRNELLATYLIQNSIWWVEYAGLDGLRVDTQPYPYKEFMAKWNKAVMAEFPTINIVGETWVSEIPVAAYFQKGTPNKDGFNSEMEYITDFPLYDAINAAFNENEGWTEGMSRLYLTLSQDFAYGNPNNHLIFCDNHDLNRFYESVGHNLKKYKMGLAYLLTTRGTPQIYYGTEILMDGNKGDGDGFIRKDFPGGWAGDSISAFTMTGLSGLQLEAYNYVKNLLNWRKSSEEVHSGQLKQFLPDDGIYVLFRYTNDKAVMLILNNKDTDKTFETSRYNEVLKDYSKGVEIISGQREIDLKTISISGKSALIIELEK